MENEFDRILFKEEYGNYNVVLGNSPFVRIQHLEEAGRIRIAKKRKVLKGATNLYIIIEGFWALLRRARYGSHHHYRLMFTPLYVSELTCKYKHREESRPWDTFIDALFVRQSVYRNRESLYKRLGI